MVEHQEEEMIHDLTSEEKLAAWGYGEWVEEPEQVNFTYKGFRCLIHRVFVSHGSIIELGHLCGYVVIAEGHPWFGKHYDDIECEIYGGLTFAETNEKEGCLIGFDCAHSMDICPGTEKLMIEARLRRNFSMSHRFFERTYKNVEFVRQELMKLVDQAIEVKNNV
jgi:hypothetical protein